MLNRLLQSSRKTVTVPSFLKHLEAKPIILKEFLEPASLMLHFNYLRFLIEKFEREVPPWSMFNG